MDPKLRAALLLNAARAPLEAFMRLCGDYGPDELEGGGERLWRELGLRPSTQERLAKLLCRGEWPEHELERMERAGARFLMADGVGYPQRLRDLAQPPIGLYVKGPADLSSFSVAVVGTRRCSAYGKSVAEGVGRALARAGLTVVSGGARGIDAAGHQGCLSVGGVTVSIFGTGLDCVYPAEHRELFEQIAERGALVSEFPFGTSGEPWRFPERNRLIVGMSGRTVVVESPEDSGAMITARLALDIGREVWCVPGRITETVCRGTNRLLRDGAQPLIDIEDFIQCVSGHYGQLVLDLEVGEEAAAPRHAPAPELTTDERVLLAVLQRQGGRTMDDLLAESGLDFVTLQTCLMTLSANGLAVSSGPGRFSASA
ncbi:MAG: DNA-processing protein DprA [Fretibacterium sp.]|nr:DNA-processing protein DprA [Fretibacterium sp.]